MKITFEDGDTTIIKVIDDETWSAALEEVFYAFQGLGYSFKKSPEEMINILDDGINE